MAVGEEPTIDKGAPAPAVTDAPATEAMRSCNAATSLAKVG